uniref:DUF1639 domain-containing protein n=1 Tax=Leersia perrieri TaxID=77586 RepID=A0A0D9V4B3_9ORYZ
MAATADPRAKPPTTAAHHLKPWVPSPTPRAHRVPSLPAVSGGGGGASRPAARDRRRSSSSHRRGGTGTDAGGVDEEEAFDGGLEDLRAKLMGHIKDVADRLHLPQPKPPRPRSPEPDPPAAPLPPPPPPPPQEYSAAAAAARPWNLRERKRRSAARGSTSSASPTRAWAARQAETARGGDERAPFAVSLAAEEIEEDIYALTGGRPRRRPRKRPRVVQRQLDSLFPGLWLTEITADAYKVPDD